MKAHVSGCPAQIGGRICRCLDKVDDRDRREAVYRLDPEDVANDPELLDELIADPGELTAPESAKDELAAVTPAKGEALCPDCFCWHRPGVECG